jgi:redox-sensing transcriptional repressor
MYNLPTKSRATIDRLPLYYRAVTQLKEEGVKITSSVSLGRKIGITPEQVRKDLSSLGEFGRKGVGYYVTTLACNIGTLLGLHKKWRIALVGFGHLGWALANYRPFSYQGFEIAAIFDKDPEKVGAQFGDMPIWHINDLPMAAPLGSFDIGAIAVPANAAQDVADRMIQAGIHGIWNFAPIRIKVPNHIALYNEDLVVGLNNLSFHLSKKE